MRVNNHTRKILKLKVGSEVHQSFLRQNPTLGKAPFTIYSATCRFLAVFEQSVDKLKLQINTTVDSENLLHWSTKVINIQAQKNHEHVITNT